MVIMNDLEWPMFSYHVIYYRKFKNVMQWTQKQALIILFPVQSESSSFSLGERVDSHGYLVWWMAYLVALYAGLVS